MLHQYAKSGRQDESAALEMKLLWLKIPNYLNGGVVEEIPSFTSGSYSWTADEKCGGDKVHEDDCSLRA